MKVLLAASEAVPYFKTGGLADVAGALPDALAAAGHEVMLALPAYNFLMPALVDARPVADLSVPWPGRDRTASVVVQERPSGASAAFIGAPAIFDTARPYDPQPGDPLSLGRRFAFFSRAVVALARAWNVDVVHLNDWQTGLAPIYGLLDELDAATVFAIHNLAYQGNFPPVILDQIGIPREFLRTENGIEFYGQASFIKGGLAIADRLVTVSPTYAKEIRTPPFGAGMHGLLGFRRRALHGVLNGIDTTVWNPARDPLLPASYGPRTIAGKDINRDALLQRARVTGDGPILGMVTRLAHQKGIDLLIAALPELVQRNCSVVILGDGDAALDHALRTLAADMPANVAVFAGFDDTLAHLIYAGSDFFLMPSLYEPCGLGQMIAQRYGTPPIARRTGGLEDTIRDGATGFLFHEPSADALLAAVDRAAVRWRARGWRALQTRCMRIDHSWRRSAADYEAIYRLATGSLTLDGGPIFR